MARTSVLFYLSNTSTVLARSAINLLRGADQAALDEAIQTLINKGLAPPAVMAHLEQNVNFGEVLEKLSAEWSDETVRAFGTAFAMDTAKKNVMDLIVAIAILNEADLEAELRAENTPQATANDLLENRRITWQYPPPGTVLNPPYVVLVAVEQVDTTKADSEIQAILGELVDYKGYRIARRAAPPGIRPLPGRINPDLIKVPLEPIVPDLVRPTTPTLPDLPFVTTPVPTATTPAPPAAGGGGGSFLGTVMGAAIPGMGGGAPAGTGAPGGAANPPGANPLSAASLLKMSSLSRLGVK
jgi:hypothetical protein